MAVTAEVREPHQTKAFTSYAQHVERALALCLSDVEPECLRDAMAYSLCGGGKLIRPALCMMTFQMYSDDVTVAIPTACALEMLHAATLIHDDLPAMDDDDYRRGRPSNHKVYGEGMALLAGDALLAYSLEHILTHSGHLPQDRLLAVMSQLIRVVGPSGLSGGQALDLDCQGRPSVERATVELMHLRKTAALIEASVITGALLAGAAQAEVVQLRSFARNLGLAYQIVDDVLDETSTFARLGKVTQHDRDSGKWTYPRVVGVDAACARAEELLAQAVGDLEPLGDMAAPLRQVATEVMQRAAR